MTRHICYDISRLLTRFFRSTPNGIDRVDYTIASHILTSPELDASASVVTGGRPLLIKRPAATAAITELGLRWRETQRAPDEDPEYARVVDFLKGGEPGPASRSMWSHSHRSLRSLGAWLHRNGIPLAGSQPPVGSVYVNASQFPLWTEMPFRWLGGRKDVRGVFFIHDLLPMAFPDYFPRGEHGRHRARLANFARYGSAAIVSTPAVAQELRDYMRGLGRTDCAIHVAPLPIAPVFRKPASSESVDVGRPFFLFCATLEPRKNHLMILDVWRALVERLGDDAPRLVLVGKRGWHYRPILDLIGRSSVLSRHVIETNHLSTPALRRLMEHARAVLMPTFGEGFGLPVYEGLTAGVPVIAADVPAFRDIDADGLIRLAPTDQEAWFREIFVKSAQVRGSSRLRWPNTDADQYFRDLSSFLLAA